MVHGSNGAHAHMKWAGVYSIGIHPLCDAVDVEVAKLVRWSLLTSPKWENKKNKNIVIKWTTLSVYVFCTGAEGALVQPIFVLLNSLQDLSLMVR